MLKFENLEVYQKAINCVKEIYRITEKFPEEEKYGITNQLRRAAISIVTNIAEGSGRFHKKEYIQFLRMSRSSSYECIALLELALQLKYLSACEHKNLYAMVVEITKMLSGLIKAIEKI